MGQNREQRRAMMLQYILRYWDEKKIGPSFRDIQQELKIRSTSTISADIHALIDAGALQMEEGSYRSLRPAEQVSPALDDSDVSVADERTRPLPVSASRDDVYDIPLYGRVAAGDPIFADDYTEESVPLPASFFRNDGADYFLLEIRGDSMIEAGILDGDHVIVRRQNTARNGQQVVALIEDSATVKTFYQRSGYIELHPENPLYDPIIVSECRILGVVCGLYRLY